MNEDIVLTPMMKQFLDLKAKHPDAVMLKIADGVDCAVKLALRLQFTADFNGLSTLNVLWYRHVANT